MSSTNPTDKAKTIEEVFCFGFEDPTFINDIHVLVGKDKIETAKAQLESIMQDYAIEARKAEHGLWKPIAEEIVAKDGVYRAVNFLNRRAQELEQLRTTNQTLKGEE